MNALILSDDRNLPLLSRETIPKRGTDEKRYELTAYGRFVHWLASYVDHKGSYSAVVRDFLTDAPEELVDEANDWVTEYTGAPRRFDSDGAPDISGDEDADEFDPHLVSSLRWVRVIEATGEAELEDD